MKKWCINASYAARTSSTTNQHYIQTSMDGASTSSASKGVTKMKAIISTFSWEVGSNSLAQIHSKFVNLVRRNGNAELVINSRRPRKSKIQWKVML